MTKQEHARRERLSQALQALGLSAEHVDALRRISAALRRWHELECGTDRGTIERDERDGRPYLVTPWGRRTRVADLERGALRRLSAIMATAPALSSYVQTDPRGAALYILRPGDIPPGARAESCYTRGICVY